MGEAAIFRPRETLQATLEAKDEMRDLLPGGYLFTHAVFWGVVALVAVGTNAVAIILSAGLVLLLLETLGKA